MKSRKRISTAFSASVKKGVAAHPIQTNVESEKCFSRNDYVLMFSLAAIYGLLALVNLGSLKAPQSYWKPVSKGDSFYVDIGRSQEIARVSYFLSFGAGSYKIDFSEDDRIWQNMQIIEQKSVYAMVEWRYFNFGHVARYIRITCEKPGAMLNEIGLFAAGTPELIPIKAIVKNANMDGTPESRPENVFDEQDTVAYRPSFINSMYFDEVYHARTAYEYLHHIEPTETTHPPLGKILISVGIAVFGMTAFGWRIMAVLCGIAMIPAIYCFAKRLFKSSRYAFVASFLFAVDFMHFTYTRIGVIDGFAVFSIIMMYYYMYQYFVMNFYTVPLKRTFVLLLLSGIFFGLGVATKWIAFFGGVGLAVILFISLGQRFYEYVTSRKTRRPKVFWPKAVLTLLWCVPVFVIIPVTVYLLSYTSVMMTPGPGYGIDGILEQQKDMYNYHSMLQATHLFSSSWWEWPIIRKPLWLYRGKDLPPGNISSIVAMGNPAIWWLGIPAILAGVFIAARKREKGMYVVLIAFVFQFLPWAITPRKLLFIYHFFASVPFLILCVAYLLKTLTERFPKFKYGVYAYLAMATALFVIFYPVLSGAVISRAYVQAYLKWFNCWVFF